MAAEGEDEKKPANEPESEGGTVGEEAQGNGEKVIEEEVEEKPNKEKDEERKEEKEDELGLEKDEEDMEQRKKNVEEKEEEEESQKKSSSGTKEAITPKERPTRERKAVERFSIASPARSPAPKSLSIAKGNGTPLKDIPNVAFKLSKRKPDDNLQLLHMILFGKKAKAYNLKKDIGQFSGFVWVDNEEKQRAKLKEKIDKCVKEKLLDFCDVLNIPINRSVVRKEDLSAKLLEFLESPHATTEVLLADEEQKAKKPKRKSTPTKSKKSKEASAEKSAKTPQVGEKRKRTSKAAEDNQTDDKDENLDSQSHSSEEDEDSVQKQASDQEAINSEKEEDETKERVTSPKSSSKDNSGAKSVEKSKNVKKSSLEKSTKSPTKKATGTSKKSKAVAEVPALPSKVKASSSKKQKVDDETQQEKPIKVEEKSTSKKQASKSQAKSTAKEKGKGKTSKEAKEEPTNEELRAMAENILKEVDFNTATLSDILRMLGSHFGLDLMHRKGEVKAIITEVIENMSNDEGDDDEDEDTDDADA